jgi:hypothetical protein
MFSLSFSGKDALRTGWTAVQAFLGAFVVLAPGIWAAPNFSSAKAASIAAITAGVAAAFSAVKNAILSDSAGIK